MTTTARRTAADLVPLVRGAWSQVLEHDRFSDQDFFFSIGGNSLAGIRLMRLLGQEVGVRLPVRMLFEHQTVELLARRVADYLVEKQQPTDTNSDAKGQA